MASLTTFKRGKTYSYRIYWTTDDGKRKSVSKGGFRLKSQAHDAGIVKMNDLRIGRLSDVGDTLLADYMDDWIRLHKVGKVAESTLYGIRRICECVRKSYNIPLNKLSRNNYQEHINQLSESYSNRTVKLHKVYLNAMLKDAYHDGDITVDVTYRISVMNINKSNKVIESLSQSDYIKLYNYCMNNLSLDDVRCHLTLYLLTSGCRYGEALSLRSEVMDYENITTTINASCHHYSGYGLGDTKNESSIRTITIPIEVMRELRKLDKGDNKLLFGNMNLATYSYWLKHTAKSLNIGNRHISPHILRHTHASLLLANGILPLTVSKRLGHANVTTTMNTYAHILADLEQSENEKINNIIIPPTD